MADTKDNAVQTEPAQSEFIEYAGEEPFGTSFLTSHTLPKGDALWKRNNVEVSKDLVWERDPMGPAIGQKGSHLRLSTEGLPADVVKVLENTPGYKRVSA
jgi:hypothetical protein